jgi:hypothetical protein
MFESAKDSGNVANPRLLSAAKFTAVGNRSSHRPLHKMVVVLVWRVFV